MFYDNLKIACESKGVKINKTNEEGRLINGAKLEIQNEKGQTIESWKTNEEIHTFKKLEEEKTYTQKINK